MKIYFHLHLSAIFLFAANLPVCAAADAQNTVSFTGKDVSLEQVFAAVKKQTGYTFVYYTEALQGAHKVTIDVKGITVEQFLELCLKDQPLTYKVIGQTVMIAKKEVRSATNDGSGDPPVADIKGKITNDKGEPLAGASVMVKGTKKGTLTGTDGAFTLKGVSPGVVLIVSYAGFVTKQIAVEKNINFALALIPSNSPLDEAQVIAYGATTERFNTGDVTTVKGEDIAKQPVDNPLLALEGRVPGLFIAQTTGLPGSGIFVQIRGQNSISNGNDPFYVIDGVPYTSELLPNLGNILGVGSFGNPSGNPLSFINPSDIESISVLKDAAATAIYGSRAANGAVLITTKKGKAGQTKVDINVQNGLGKVTRKVDLMNTNQYLTMRDEGLSNDGIPPSLANGDYDLLQWDTTRYTDWQKSLIGGTAGYTNVSTNVSGGTALTQYLMGGTFHRQTTVFPGDFFDQKGAAHFNVTSMSSNQKFHVQLTGSYMFDNNHLPQADLTSIATVLAPDAPPLYNTDGSLNWAPTTSGSSTWQNPLANNYNTYQNKTSNLISNAIISYQILPGLDLKSNFGYTNMQSNEFVAFPLLSTQPEYRPSALRSANYGNNNMNSWIVEPQATYKTTIEKGRLEVLAGMTLNQINSNGVLLEASGFNSDQVLGNILAANYFSVQSTTATVYKYNALFGRLDYNWQDKYVLDLTVRRDGSSRFGPSNEFHNFGAAGVSWIFSEEKWIKNTLHFLSFGKLRVSYGTTGNDQIGDYKYLNLYNPISVQIPYQGIVGLQPVGLTNPYLQWEETKKSELGGDLGMYKDRLLLSVSYYKNLSSNQLLSYQLPYITGFNNITRNFPATVENTGWEFTLRTNNIRKKDFDWTTHINMTIPQNKLVAFPNLSTSTYANTLMIGQPTYILHLYHFMGVNPSTGLYQFSDGKNGTTSAPDTVSNYFTSHSALANPTPKFYGGIENDFRYRAFELDFLFQFIKQIGPNFLFGNFIPGYEGQTEPTYTVNRWQKPGDIAKFQRYNSTGSLGEQWGDATQSDAAYSNASFIRLKNLSLSWQFPAKWLKASHFQNGRLFVNAQNLFTFTHYIGLDPETKSTSTLPPLKIVTLGLQVTL